MDKVPRGFVAGNAKRSSNSKLNGTERKGNKIIFVSNHLFHKKPHKLAKVLSVPAQEKD